MKYNCNFGSLGIATSVMSSHAVNYTVVKSALCAAHLYFFVKKKKQCACVNAMSLKIFFFQPIELSLHPLETDQIKNLLSLFFFFFGNLREVLRSDFLFGFQRMF